ncbi:hypothetical protein A3709_19975 [Halioglobus sp. HI00S01]|uniref:hypothetical protein n=1 Tax=Halioglobus sp. HI00S01 TaxID=1822214 RepID=UPI0007C32FC8|nr:hypothetical protein [Halioglobus sp. HI00S01]KZX57904.1 hypothetical protein A3709_19975 [Halioglobus sp. HI00S01]
MAHSLFASLDRVGLDSEQMAASKPGGQPALLQHNLKAEDLILCSAVTAANSGLGIVKPLTVFCGSGYFLIDSSSGESDALHGGGFDVRDTQYDQERNIDLRGTLSATSLRAAGNLSDTLPSLTFAPENIVPLPVSLLGYDSAYQLPSISLFLLVTLPAEFWSSKQWPVRERSPVQENRRYDSLRIDSAAHVDPNQTITERTRAFAGLLMFFDETWLKSLGVENPVRLKGRRAIGPLRHLFSPPKKHHTFETAKRFITRLNSLR